jgi:hypothetical protein
MQENRTGDALSRIAHDQDRRKLGEQFEAACALAASLYAEGRDTTEADAEVDRLAALLETA